MAQQIDPKSFERKPWSDRGFLVYGDEFRCEYGSVIYVTESSAWGMEKMWLRVDDTSWTDSGGNAAAHLDRDGVLQLVARLQAWLDDHPEGAR